MNEFNRHILLRKNIPEPLFVVGKVLELYDMGQYTRLCNTRIVDKELLDGKHIDIDISNGLDLVIDKVGLIKCEDILRGYLSEEEYQNMEDAIWSLSDAAREKNMMLEMMRGYRWRTLCKVLLESMKVKDDIGKDVQKKLFLELYARTPINQAWNFMTSKARSLYIELRYWKPLKMFKKAFKEIAESERDHLDVKPLLPEPRAKEPKGKYVLFTEALDRFLEKHEGQKIPDELNVDDIQKYVYLGVNKVLNTRRIGHKEYISLEEASSIMDAIGMLTPNELQQLFPIQKTYDGEKYQEKDYFFSRDMIQKHGWNTPIGREKAFKFLVDYENIHLYIFVLDYFSALEDKYVANGGKPLWNELFCGEQQEGAE